MTDIFIIMSASYIKEYTGRYNEIWITVQCLWDFRNSFCYILYMYDLIFYFK